VKRVLRIAAWILFWPLILPIWLSFRFPKWLRWTYWIVAGFLLLAGLAASNRQTSAPSMMLLDLSLALVLFLIVKAFSVSARAFARKTPAPLMTDVTPPASPVLGVAISPISASGRASILSPSGTTDLSSLDALGGIEFEHFVATLLTGRGYKTEVTQASGDYGIDIIAIKDGVRFGVQVKRYAGSVARTAVSDAVAGVRHWRCHAAMVVTNSYFTDSAKQLAESTGCVLVDRAVLAQWLTERNLTTS